MIEETLFPTLGEFTKALFELSGVMPNKYQPDSETDKKTLQSLLRKLVKEEGNLIENYIKIISVLTQVLDDVAPSEAVFLACYETFAELENTYKFILIDDATHLDKADSLKWVLNSFFIHRLVLSIEKNYYRFGVYQIQWEAPADKFWFLPGENQKQTPLAKYLSWLYIELGLSQTQFHHRNKISDPDNPVKKRNFGNASDWINAKRLPSWALLKQTLNEGFDDLKDEISASRRQELLFLAFIARLSTKVCESIRKGYGNEFLNHLVDQYKSYKVAIQPHIADMQKIALNVDSTSSLNGKERNQLIYHSITSYWEKVAEDSMRIAYALREKQKRAISQGNQPEYQKLFQASGSEFIAQGVLNILDKPVEFDQETRQIIYQGFQLLNQKDISTSSIKAFKVDLDQYEYSGRFMWMYFWMVAKLNYRQGNIKESFDYYKKAFESGKYSAGKSQYILVNEFLLLSAKADIWKEFKKGLAWANFLGIEVRCHREVYADKEQAEQLFHLFKVLDYSV